MANRQGRRESHRDRRRQEQVQARRELRLARATPTAPESKPKPEPAPPKSNASRWIWPAVGGIIAVLFIALVAYVIRENTAPLPGTHYPSLGNNHVNPGDPHAAYNTNPPTSGPHYPTWPNRGIYTEPLPEEYMIHFMEHAGVDIWYDPNKLSTDQVKQLQDIVKSELTKGQGLVLLSPTAATMKMPHPIALTAWQQLEYFDPVTGNKSKMEDFIERLECHYDPENVCGGGQHGNSFIPTGTPAAGEATVVGSQVPSNIAPATAQAGQIAETQTPVSGTPAP